MKTSNSHGTAPNATTDFSPSTMSQAGAVDKQVDMQEHKQSSPNKKALSLSVVVPVYNSQSTLETLIACLHEAMIDISDVFEIILIDDCSQDNSWPVILSLRDKYPDTLRAWRLRRNFGQHNALLCGIRAASNSVVVTMDDDLQHQPAEIARLLGPLNSGFDVVYGKPVQEQHGMLRTLASQITKLALQNAMGAENARSISAFRAFRTELRTAFSAYDAPQVNIDVLLTWATGRFTAVPISHRPRAVGASSYNLVKLTNHAVNMLTGFSVLPLQLASLNGFICLALGAVLLIYVMLRVLFYGCPVAGFPFLASIIIIFSGSQLVALGIIGEYLARIYLRTMNRPAYVVEASARPAQKEAPQSEL